MRKNKPNTDNTVVILSSLVAGSRVGGGVASDVLSQAGFWPQHVPTTILGRHPGLGTPGGGPVPDEVFASALSGLASTKTKPKAVLTGYFATPYQVRTAAAFIQSIKARSPGSFILVDPVLGDGKPDGSDHGLYVPRGVAQAIGKTLLPHADLITPNVYELSWLSGRKIEDKNAAQQSLENLDCDGVVTSVPDGPESLVTLGKLSSQTVSYTAQYKPGIDHGTGDLFAALMLRFLLQQETAMRALQLAHQAIQESIATGRFARD